jgi:large subunit ribosomal protein L20
MRVTRGNVNRKRHKKVLKITKGFKGGRGNFFRAAMQAMMRALKRAYTDRRLKKRDFRGLWIQRINAASNEQNISYSKLIGALKKSNIALNRKMLAEIAANDPNAFAKIVETVKVAVAK